MSNLTSKIHSPLAQHLQDLGLLIDREGTDLVVATSVYKTAAMYGQSKKLAEQFASAKIDQSPYAGTVLTPNLKSKGYIDRYIRTLGSIAVSQRSFKEEVVRKDLDEMAEEAKKLFPEVTTLGHAKFYALAGALHQIHSGGLFPEDLSEFPNGCNPLAECLRKLSGHTASSKLNNDPVERILSDWSSPLEPPNCLANAVTMVSLLKLLKMRFYLVSGLRLASGECRKLRLEALKSALNLVAERPQFKWVEDALHSALSGLFDEGCYDWMYHHCVLVQLDEATDEWAILDPFMDTDTYMPNAGQFTQLANALDARKKHLPGLAVPIDVAGSFSAKQLTTLRRKLRIAERHINALVEAYLCKAEQAKLVVTLSEVRQLFADDVKAARAVEWLVKSWATVNYHDPELTERFGDPVPAALDRTISGQIFMAKNVLGHEPVPWFISRAINICMLEPCFDQENLIISMGHPALELYADHDYMLGLLLSSAVAASTGLRVLSPELLRLTSSQLIWREVAEKEAQYDSIPLCAARRIADSYIGELPEHWLHPLVANRRRALGLIRRKNAEEETRARDSSRPRPDERPKDDCRRDRQKASVPGSGRQGR